MTREPSAKTKRKLSQHFVNSDTEEEGVDSEPLAKRRKSPPKDTPGTTQLYTRYDQVFWNPDNDCLCRLLRGVPYFDRDSPLGDGVKRLVAAANACSKHWTCCSTCKPQCHSQRTPTSQDTAIRPSRGHILENLHPVPQNWIRMDRRRFSKQEKRMYEEQAWQIHFGLVMKLQINPYSNCVCDVVGLDDHFQVVEDPISEISYAHRARHCLAYPIDSWALHPRHPSMHEAQIPAIHDFRRTGRTKGGSKKFTKKALYELERQCGLHYAPPSTPGRHRHCLCGLLSEDSPSDREDGDLRNQTCARCGICCPCCSPSCHGLTLNDSQARFCSKCGTCCPQCRPGCEGQFRVYGSESELIPQKPAVVSPRRERNHKKKTSRTHKFVARTDASSSEAEANNFPLRPNKNTSKQKSESSSRSKVKPHREMDLEQENWPTSYDPASIASDILRVAGKHPKLPPLNAHLKDVIGFEDLVKTKRGKKSRKTA